MEQIEHPLTIFIAIRVVKHKSGYTATVEGLPAATVEDKVYKQEAIDEAAAKARKIINLGIVSNKLT
jgi:hypothetical protein